MNRKLFTPILALGLILCLMAPGAYAWEFSMDGTFTWLYETRGQLGTNGFFGKFDTDAGIGGNNAAVAGTYAPYNFYVGGWYLGRNSARNNTASLDRYDETAGSSPYGGRPYAQGQLVSGSDADWNTQYMLANMQIRMNPAVRIRGAYYVGSWANPTSSVSAGNLVAYEYSQAMAHGVQRSFSPGYWRTMWLTAQLPWGEIAVGKRPSSWGMGLTFDGADNRASESISLAAPLGPFRIQMSMHPSRPIAGPPDDYGTVAGSAAAGTSSTGTYFNPIPDKSNTRAFDMTIPNITYNSGPLSAGIYTNWRFNHRGGEARIAAPGTTSTQRSGIATADYSEWYGGAYLKYNNGRFFVNSEFQTFQAITKSSLQQAVGTSNGQYPIPPIDTEFYAGAIEAGVLAGPAKVALIGAWLTGDDIRVGSTVISGAGQQFLYKGGRAPDTFSNTSVFRPYSYLMVYSYGLGNSFAKDTGNGYVSDASVYAGRLDYALAANLNIFGSFMWAERFSKSGYTWGNLRPAGQVFSNDTAAAAVSAHNGEVIHRNVMVNGGPGVSVPTIPDTALGWEVDGGFDWKLLEDLTARCTIGYWVPGKWWNYATIDKSIPGWSNPSNGASWGSQWFVNPGKTIDPIWGMEFKLEGSF